MSFVSVLAQNFNHNEKIFKEVALKLSIDRENEKAIQYLNIINTRNDSLIKSLKIDNEFDLHRIGAYYFGERNFAIITGRYQFFIVNLTTNTLKGPYRSNAKGKRYDAQSGLVCDFKIFNNGQYLLFEMRDFGVKCFKLIDLYNPLEIGAYTLKTKSLKEFYFFLDKRDSCLFNGIISSYEFNRRDLSLCKLTSNFLFQGYHLKTDDNGLIIKNQIEDRYLLLYKETESNREELIVVDYEDGKLLNKENDETLINRLLNEL